MQDMSNEIPGGYLIYSHICEGFGLLISLHISHFFYLFLLLISLFRTSYTYYQEGNLLA